ncbi:molybdenum cofactor guanylyltransferase [Hyphobacterium marinum]|uniref:NTP transferase domain-containing protein n=1 Tax=Hyphobacterium marinum TaxID=3116574 RepID=A0ABU7LUC8_9PROT|nr:NTP transferase domain-containing protein [Hyphobacterium sp. Y6023]MEE2565173.1 NTP transferase domain-containing protein [Hyphobacterium sp. Y6023]
MSTPASITGLILAGGKSSRMGTDKAALVLDGETLLDRARRILREAGAERVIVLGRSYEADGWPDPPGGKGPGVALASALNRLADSGPVQALVIPVDMPCLTPHSLKALIRSGPSAHYQNDPLPLYFAPDARLPTPDTVRSVRDVVKAVGALALRRPGNERVLANINTPDAFADLSGGTGPD